MLKTLQHLLLPIFIFLMVDSSLAQSAKNNKVSEWKSGALSFEYNDQQYDAFIFDPSIHKVGIHWKSKTGTAHKTLLSVKQELESQKRNVLMLTNAGMYLTNSAPMGLFVQDGKQLRAIITRKNSTGNFYMQPNGVFYSDKNGKCAVITTKAYTQLSPTKKNELSYATQSGPMLVVDGAVNNKFNSNSQNINLRSGVGILPDGRTIFIISQSYFTTFYDFASIFKQKFGCKNALFLDGSISRMYLKNSRPDDTGGEFGAIISVVSKQ